MATAPSYQKLKLLRDIAGTRAYKEAGDECNLEDKLGRGRRQEGQQQLVRSFLFHSVLPAMEQLDKD
jgi:hypothetical protein